MVKLLDIGDYKINLNQLNKNKITILTDGGTFTYRQELISDDLKNVIKLFIQGKLKNEEVDNEKLELLSDIDQKIFNELLQKCRIENNFSIKDYNLNTRKNEIIQRFNVIKAEILLGNESEELLEEFKEILDALIKKKLITRIEYNKLYSLI